MITRNRFTMSVAAALFATSVAAGGAGAQSSSESPLEIRPFVGAFIPTGDQREMIDDAITAGVQGAYTVTSYLSIVATFSVTPSSDTRLALDDDLDVFSYDIGVEIRKVFIVTKTGVTLSPFLGLGGGGRTYDYRTLETHAESNITGYGALGAHLSMGAIGFRIEARDYVSSFNGLIGEMNAWQTRNDVAILSALSFSF